jgi:DNA-binding transcriptional MerR regulator
MRIGELSQRSGVAIPTIKYYLREGLLAPGTATAANQAAYGDEHLRRLRLIRALVDVGGVSVAAAREVIGALAREDLDPLELLGVAHDAVTPRRTPDRDSAEWAAARETASALVVRHDWMVSTESVGLDLVADVISALRSLGVAEAIEQLDRYADLAQSLAAFEVAGVIARDDPARRMELVVIGTVLGEALFAALRLLAHQHESAVQLGYHPTENPPGPATKG